MSTQFLGKMLSLTTGSQVRYEGTLVAIAEDFTTLTLAAVRMFGTENRQATLTVPPSNTKYECIVFNAQDITDIRLASQPVPPEEFQDPAIVSATIASQSTTTTTQSTPASKQTTEAKEQKEQKHVEKKLTIQRPVKPQADPSTAPASASSSDSSAAPSLSSSAPASSSASSSSAPAPHHTPSHPHFQRPPRPTIAAPVIEGEFNFEEANAKFDKASELKEVIEKVQPFSSAYNPKNFFDALSRDTDRRPDRSNRETQRRADDETFGSDASEQQRQHFRETNNRNNNSNTRGRGRGRGRGAYNSNNNYNANNNGRRGGYHQFQFQPQQQQQQQPTQTNSAGASERKTEGN
eukprot:TRINITY_DN367_c1_g2_i1.p1 TRINITY_DN367_c1_g2~~TRINITY_DN367_c1_g2_i1.p1  ORF type:complete len:350 (-),score=70.34 TRINITY_DN367_c1_g2_i1:88-1137(-)